MEDAQTNEQKMLDAQIRFNVILEDIQRKLLASNDADKASIERDKRLEERLDKTAKDLGDQIALLAVKTWDRFDKLEEQTRGRFDKLEAQTWDRFDKVDERFDKVDKRFDEVDKRFDKLDKRFDKVDKRFDKLDKRFDKLDKRVGKIDKGVGKIEELATDGQRRLGRIETHLKLGPPRRTLRARSRRAPMADDVSTRAKS